MADFNPDTKIVLEIGFASTGVNDTGFAWTDVTGDLRSFDIARGRTFELDEIEAGTGIFILDNNARKYDPASTGSVYAPNVDVMKPVRFTAVHSGTTYHLFRGYVDGWPRVWPGMTDAVTELSAVDGFKVLAFWEVASTSPQEASGTRVGRLLDDVSWSTSLRDLDAGDVTCIAYTPDCAFALSELERVAKTEEGVFFMSGAGAATFHDHSHRTASTSIGTFTDTGGGLPYTQPLQFAYDDSNIWNDITVAGVGVQPQATDSTASVDKYGRRKFRRFDTLHHNATSAMDTAGEILTRYKDPVTRIPEITVDPVSDTGLWPHVLGREISDRVTIRQATKSATTGVYAADHHIEGIRHYGTVGQTWECTWLLSPST